MYCLPIHKNTNSIKHIKPTTTHDDDDDGDRRRRERNKHARPDDDDDDGGHRVVSRDGSRTRRLSSASRWDARRSGGASLSSVEGTTERGRARRADDEDEDEDDEDDGVGVARWWWIGRW